MKESAAEITGHCSCGQCSFTLSCSPLIVHCCHCRWCQKETGTAFAVNGLIETSNVNVLSGDIVKRVVPSASGQGQTLGQCSECRATLFSHYAYPGVGDGMAFIRMGTLNEPDRFPPDVHIYTRSKVSWLPLPKDSCSFDAYYRKADVWRASSLNRLTSLLAARQAKEQQAEMHPAVVAG